MTQLYTPAQAGERLAVSRDSVYRLIAAGELRAVDVSPKGSRKSRTRISEKAIAEYVERKERSARRLYAAS